MYRSHVSYQNVRLYSYILILTPFSLSPFRNLIRWMGMSSLPYAPTDAEGDE